MAFRAIMVFCALALPMTNAVINTNSIESKIERREAFQTYGPPPIQSQPQQQTIVLPTPVYGAPAIGKYPPPPPERPPLPSKEYGIPVRQYGPPKVQIEYGAPPVAQSHQQIQTNNHRHQQVINHNSQNSLSFFDQIKETFGFGSSGNQPPHQSYGPPPQAPINHFTPPKVYTKYGVPSKPQFISKPPTIYGPPQSKPHTNYGPPKQYQPPVQLKPFYGPPIKPAVNFKPQQPQPQIRQPLPGYGVPVFQSIPSFSHQQSIPSFPKPIKGAGCDGWKPIPGPSFGSQSIGHSGSASIPAIQPENVYLPPQSNPPVESTFSIQPENTYEVPQLNTHTVPESVLTVHPDNTYLPPVANSLHVADSSLAVHPLPTNLQLPVAEATSFHNDVNLGSNIASGLGLTSINVVKSEGIELSNNFVDSYSLPPADSFAPNFHKRPPTGLTPPNSFPYPLSFKRPIHVSAPRHPVSFRPPVPQGLLESIGQSVQHQDQFGVKIRPQSNVYLPPPTNEIPPPLGHNSLPLAPAVPFHSGPPKGNLFDHQFVYSPSPCSHGPNLAGGHYASSSNQFGSIPQLQTVYGVPNNQALDVSQSSSFEIAQNSGNQGLLTSYGPPASGNPADSFAHGSQKSLTTVQIDSVNSSVTSNVKHEPIDTLPGLSSSGLDIISAQKSVNIEIPVQGQHGSYSLQFQAADPLASQNNEIDTPDHQKLLDQGLLQSILSAIEQPKSTDQSSTNESLDNHPDVNEFAQSTIGQETLAEVKAE
ncbi:proline-rich extensin-like protein EPR1 [Contarinia nasturtii]|uniref:proline-rich extensin-like protein EPR1 n=1 Tax=Contarinia nasturtii TaxID=265458 RepID=UPI0012D38218|nr:proline-rich extensin-like protein EPR1 [Contarinia nasturtii]